MSTVTASLRERTGRLTDVAVILWALALAGTLGDYTVTLYGLQQPGIHEAVPISQWALDVAGPLGLAFKDLVLTAGLGLVFVVIPRPYSWGVPLGIAGARWWLVWSNLAVLGVL